MGRTATRNAAISIAVALTFGLAACSGGDAGTPAAEVVTDEKAEFKDSVEDGVEDGVKDKDVEPEDGNLFVSEEYGFEIGFPGDPEIDRWEEEDSGRTYTGTSYVYEGEDGSYVLSVSQVPLAPDEILDASVGADAAVRSVAHSTGGTEVSVNTGETFLGEPSASAHLKVDRNGTVKDLYTRVVIRGNTIFQMTTIGLDEHKFRELENSFAFID